MAENSTCLPQSATLWGSLSTDRRRKRNWRSSAEPNHLAICQGHCPLQGHKDEASSAPVKSILQSLTYLRCETIPSIRGVNFRLILSSPSGAGRDGDAHGRASQCRGSGSTGWQSPPCCGQCRPSLAIDAGVQRRRRRRKARYMLELALHQSTGLHGLLRTFL